MNQETKEKLIVQAEAAKKKALAAASWCKEKTVGTWKSGRKGKAVCIGVAAAVLLMLLKCGGGGNDESHGSGRIAKGPAALLKKAEMKTAETGNINFFGFYTGMAPEEAEALGKHYGFQSLGKDALEYKVTPISREVYEIRLNLKAVQQLTKGGNSFDELVQSVAFRVVPLDYQGDNRYQYETINGNKLYMRPPVYVNFNGEKDGGVLSLEDPALGRKAYREQEELEKREEARKWEAVRAEVETINRDLRKGDSHRPGETKTLSLPGNATMEMVWCPPGAFMMGSPEDSEGHEASAVEHRVTLSEGFWMAKTEVTQAQWEKVMGSIPSMKMKGNDIPVANVTWLDCLYFCQRSGLALPSETQWEYACRAGSTGAYGGTGRLDEMGWYDGNSGKELHPVGKKKANAWGLHDMHGNVAEWCADSAIQYSHECVTNPPVREKGDNRVIRGGAVPVGAEVCRSFSWLQFDIAKSSGAIGFRPVCLDLEAQGQMTKKTERLRMELEGLGQGKQAGETKTIHLFDGASMEMAWCPPGTFLMGKNDGEENTQRKVTLTSGFWLAKTEVTQAQWKDVMGFNPAEFKTDSLPIDIDNSAARIGDNLPVGVSWNWSQQFCLKTGLKLPTEAQWEYACRAGGILQEPFTYEQQKAMAWTGMSGPPNPVATKQPNAWGLFDMVGNVAEWCTDWFERSLGSAASTDPSGPDTGTAKVLKGGTCMTLCECSPSARVGVNPLSVEKHTGFRPCYP